MAIGLWETSTFQTVYGLASVATAIVEAMLTRADYRIQGYLGATNYATAISGTNAVLQSTATYVQADLTRLYLQDSGITTAPIQGYSESYDGVKKYTKKYAVNETALSEDTILSRLSAYALGGSSLGVPKITTTGTPAIDVLDAADD